MNKYYITTPIYYVNDVPHIGHAYTTAAADVLSRYWRQRLREEKVFFLTGADEHGAKVAQAAKVAGQNPKEFADVVVTRFQDSWKLLNIGYNHFIRTTDPRHEKIVQEVLQKIYEKGLIYKGVYEGLYCEGCEKFLSKEDLVNGKCPLHPNKEPIQQREKNYFFKLSSFKERLTEIFSKDEYAILPASRKNEILGKLQNGLQDVSISRAGVSWGIQVPWDKEQTIYVWVDALFNYYSATRFLENKENFWPPDLHLIGKDILWFHTVIWGALLLAAELPLPKKVFAHGFFTINGQKMSKSLGNVISPNQIVDKFGPDGSRYLLLSEFPFGEDGDFSFEKLEVRYNSDLANGVGNLAARVAKLAEQSNLEFPDLDDEHKAEDYHAAMQNADLYQALAITFKYVREDNQYIDRSKPWELLKEGGQEELEKVLKHLVSNIRKTGKLLYPFMPSTARKIQKQFAGPKIKSAGPLFPRLNL